MIQGPKIGGDTWIRDVQIEDTEEGLTSRSPSDRREDDVPIAEASRTCTRGSVPAGRRRAGRHGAAGDAQIVARSAEVAAMAGTFDPSPLAHPVEVNEATERCAPQRVVRIDVDPATGTFALDGSATAAWWTAGIWVTPTTTPRRARTPSSTRPAPSPSTSTSAARSGHASASPAFDWPASVDGSSQARVGSHPVDVTTVVEVRADEATVRVTTSFVNPSGDHRLRVHLPLPEPTALLPGRPRRLRRCRHEGLTRPKAGPTNSGCRRRRPTDSSAPGASRWSTKECASTS